MFHIAFVDDNPSEILLTKVTCEDLGFTENEKVSFFEDEDSMFKAIEENSDVFNLIFLDVNIGSSSGFDVLTTLIKKGYKTPIFMYSNSNSSKDIQKSKENKARGYIQKPYDYDNMKHLIQTIRESLNNNSIQTLVDNKLNLFNK